MVLVGDTLYISGILADPTQIAAGISPEQEVRDIMEQVKQVVEQAGMTMSDLASLQVFCIFRHTTHLIALLEHISVRTSPHVLFLVFQNYCLAHDLKLVVSKKTKQMN